MTDPLAKYVRGNGTTQYYDCEAMAADLRRIIPVVEAADNLLSVSDAIERLDAEEEDTAKYLQEERVLSAYYDDAILGVCTAVRRYREGV